MKPFETERLYLRPLSQTDLKDIYSLYSNPKIMKYISGEPSSFEESQRFLEMHIADHKQHGFGLCAAILKETNHMIGRCGLIPIKQDFDVEGDIAWMFQPVYWNQGYATEFAIKMVEIGFEELKLKRIQASAATQNYASIQVIKKAGLQFVKEDSRGVLYEIYP